MTSATMDAPEPNQPEMVTAFAALIMRGTKANASVAKQLAEVLVKGGATLDVAEQGDLEWLEQAFAAIDADPPAPLTVEEVVEGAKAEAFARLTTLAAHSASQLIPSVSDHAQINLLLDEVAA